ncbi:MAG: polysaccharide deacetylase [Pseudomonadota bacterium]
MTPEWQNLRAELAAWRAAGQHPSVWWRDDDAVEPSHALDRLERLSEAFEVPIYLAVIPRQAGPAIAERVASAHKTLVPVVHGWAHANHAPDGCKKAEFGHPRRDAEADLHAGLKKLRGLFGARLLPLFVPPWNRFDLSLSTPLARLGYCGISAFGTEPREEALPFLNTHIDPIDWHGTRSLASPDLLLASLVELLQERRALCSNAPIGLLTHHLVQDEAIWSFAQTVFSELLEGGALAAPLPALLEPPHEQT